MLVQLTTKTQLQKTKATAPAEKLKNQKLLLKTQSKAAGKALPKTSAVK